MKPFARHAFTLIEMLIVVSIIGVLIAIALVIGRQVGAGAKATATRGALGTLDAALTEYMSDQEHAPPPTFTYKPEGSTNTVTVAVADARPEGADQEMINSVGWFMLQCQQDVPAAARTFQGVPARLISRMDLSVDGSWDQPELLTITDAWGRPVRYVHPKFDGLIVDQYPAPIGSGANMAAFVPLDRPGFVGPAPAGAPYAFDSIRRNNAATPSSPADSDGGTCQGQTPYFYSAGPDGDPSTVDDNVYTVAPRFAGS